jgi:hypothetical protein
MFHPSITPEMATLCIGIIILCIINLIVFVRYIARHNDEWTHWYDEHA